VKVALIEDEVPALEHLERLLSRVAPAAVVVARLRTVRQTRAWLAGGEADLVLADVELGDGTSLDAFADCARDVPIVFTTAHDHYLAPALATNGIAYLLKPIGEADLAGALDKLARLERHFVGGLAALARRLAETAPVRPDRLVGRRGLDWVSLSAEAVAYVRVRNGMTLATAREGHEVLLDEPLSAVQARLDPARFLRVNRWTVVALDAIDRVRSEGRGRLLLILRPPADEEVVVPQENAATFRAWFGMRSTDRRRP
jgi:DNA-binding LytR/AlgR family response regulator